MTKDDWKFAFDVLASIASIVAIVTALAALYRSSRRPLCVYRTLIHWDRQKNASRVFLYVRNRKDYPVTLKTVDCYTQKTFLVERDRGGPPRFSATFSGQDQVFLARPETEILANADMHVELPFNSALNTAQRLLYLLDTSHGHHQVWCKDVVQVEIGKVTVRSAEYRSRLHARWRAMLLYRWKKTLYALGRVGGRD